LLIQQAVFRSTQRVVGVGTSQQLEAAPVAILIYVVTVGFRGKIDAP
jgi:hypothetical protein